MISIYINQEYRSDVLIQAGGSLEQTSEHTSSSDITIRVPADAAPIKECDYIQIYDGETIIYAGTVLKCEQTGFPITPPWRLYTLSLASNSDLVASIYVDLGFPQNATINHILFGNYIFNEDYDPSLPQFLGIFNGRIKKEGISIGTVDDFSNYRLSQSALLWGRTVLDVLDELATVVEGWWEITPDKVFNMRFSNNRPKCDVQLTQDSNVFDLTVSQDALTLYSACRVIGGRGEVPANGSGVISVLATAPTNPLPNDQYIVWQDDQTLVSSLPLARIATIIQNPASAYPTPLNVGYAGINDDDPNYQALISYGGTEITLKDGVGSFVKPTSTVQWITCTGLYFLTDVFSRVVDNDMAAEIASARGGTGIVEYTLEDDTITTFSEATIAALDYLASYAKKAVSISFSSFFPLPIGGELSCNLPYYSVTGAYQITQITTEFILDSNTENVLAKYTITASNIPYRDPYKALWFTPQKVNFELSAGTSPASGYYYKDDIKIVSDVSAYSSMVSTWRSIQNRAPSWEMWENSFGSWDILQNNNAPYTWEDIEQLYPSWESFEANVLSWAFLQGLEEVFFSTVNALTQAGKQALVSFLSGNASTPFDIFGNVLLNWTETNGQDVREEINYQDFSSLGNGGITTFYFSATDHIGILNSIQVNIPNTTTAAFLVPLNIDHSGGQVPGEPITAPLSAITLAIRNTIQ